MKCRIITIRVGGIIFKPVVEYPRPPVKLFCPSVMRTATNIAIPSSITDIICGILILFSSIIFFSKKIGGG